MKNDSSFYKFTYHVAMPFAKRSLKGYSFTHSKKIHLKEPTLVLCNHTTEVDAFMVASCFCEHMYIVCGEHLLRSKNGPILKKLFNPIPASKGASHLAMIKDMTKRLKGGSNIMLFPEGSRSFNGITENIGDSIGKLIKMSGCALATVHTTGGYFVAPRWAYHFRKGPMTAEVKHVLSASQLKEMKASDIARMINEDIYEDAYETQRILHHKYTAESGLAEGIENFLVICPECGGYDSFVSKGRDFSCTCCGLAAIMDDEGFIHRTDEEENAPLSLSTVPLFDSVSDWGKWIEKQFDEDMASKDDATLLFTETDIRLYSINSDAHTTKDIATGSLLVYKDRMELVSDAHESIMFMFKDISDEAMLYYGKSILFTHTSGYYGLTGEAFHAWKESRLYRNFMAEYAPERKMNAQ